MSIPQGVHLIAGSLVLITLALEFLAERPPALLLATALFGVSLLQSAFTGCCPSMLIARLLGFRRPQSSA